MTRDTNTQNPQGHVHLQDWLILVGLSIVWGSSFILIKKGLVAFEPIEMAILRIEITGIAFVPIYVWLAKRSFPRNKLGWAASVGVLGSGLPAFLFAFGETVVPSSVAGILNSLTPIFTWGIGLLFFSLAYTTRHMIGVSLGFLGALLIIALQPDFRLQVEPMTLLIVLATLSYAASGNIVKAHLQHVDPIALSSIAFLFIGVPAILFSFSTDIYTKLAEHPESWYSFGAIAILALLGTVLANILFYRLIQRTNAVYASSVAYLIPLMALIWGFVDGEMLHWTHFAGMVLILAGHLGTQTHVINGTSPRT